MSEIVFPPEFSERMQTLLHAEWDEFVKIHSTPAPVSIRLNPGKLSPPHTDRIPWTAYGQYLPSRPVFTLDPLFHAGAYYVQEPSSMFLEHALRQTVDLSSRLRVLDLSAAPGGKATHILSLITRDSLLVANEVIRSRASILSENLMKWGYPNALVTNNDPSDYSALGEFFDVIVVDAPCSGEGLFRKDPAAITAWSAPAADLCAARQRRILNDIWPALKKGGILIYSTCTYNEAENENNLEAFSHEENCSFEDLSPEASWNIVSTEKGRVKGYRMYPHKAKGEGFFISALRKQTGDGMSKESKLKRRLVPASRQTMDALRNWTSPDHGLDLFQHNDLVFGFPSGIADDVERVMDRARFVYGGVNIASRKHDKFIPEHGLALSLLRNPDAFPSLQVDRATAIKYLRKDTIPSSGDAKGYLAVTFENVALGWVKAVPGRLNNLYPPEWRVRMTDAEIP